MRHRWKFHRAGGLSQLVIRSGQDIVRLRELDQKLWVALACPTQGLELDERTLTLLDTDHDGRLRPPEILATAAWLESIYRNPDELLVSRDYVALSAINDRNEPGHGLLATAKRVLELIGKAGSTQIELADVMDRGRIAANMARNGDGIVPPESAPDPTLQRAMAEILATCGSIKDRRGQDGIDQPRVDAFFAEAAAYLSWAGKAQGDGPILPLGDATAAAVQAIAEVRAKVEDYFSRCRLAGFDPRATAVLGGTESDLLAIAQKELHSVPAELAKLPLGRIEAARPLPLTAGTNPAWTARLMALREQAVTKLLGTNHATLSEADWATLTAKLAPYEAWQAEKPATKVESLGTARLRELVDSDVKARITALIAADAALAPEFARIEELEKLIRCQRDFVRLLNNFVSFGEFYGLHGATFQAGTLYLDGRACNLCILVRDAGKHAALAGLSKTYLAYCDLARVGEEKRSIVAAFTNGDVDNLMVGRNGVFYDRKGRDWDATITKIIEHPISIRQAFWSPYKSLIRLLEEHVARRAAAAESDAQKRIDAAAQTASSVDKAKPVDPKAGAAAEKKGLDVGTVAAIGVGVGGIATFVTSIVATFLGLGMWMPLGLLALLLAISGPSMFVAWLKLRQRNLGPILDANGWAVNGRVKITPSFAGVLTDLPELPSGSERALRDPFDRRTDPWLWAGALVVLLGIGLAYGSGQLDTLLPERARVCAHPRLVQKLGRLAPSCAAPADPAKK